MDLSSEELEPQQLAYSDKSQFVIGSPPLLQRGYKHSLTSPSHNTPSDLEECKRVKEWIN